MGIVAGLFLKTEDTRAPMSGWFVYMVRCADDTLYTGIAMDVARRVEEHNTCARSGARYTRSRRPVTLVYQEAAESRSAAARREHEIKCKTRQQKEELLLRHDGRGRARGVAT